MVISILRAICVMVALSASSLGAIVFDIYDLGTLHTDSSYASDINDSGQICGGYFTDNRGHSTFVFSDESGLQILDTPQGARLNQINEVGQIRGSVGGSIFLWDPNSGFSNLGSLGGHSAQGCDMNVHGQIVGYLFPDESGKVKAFIWSDGIITLLEVPDFDESCHKSFAHTIDDTGVVAGTVLYPYKVNGEGKGMRSKLVVWDHLLEANDVQLPFKICVGSATTITKDGYLICYTMRKAGDKEFYAINLKSNKIIQLPANGKTNDQLTIVTGDGVYQPTHGWFGGIKGWKFQKFLDCVPALSDKDSIWEKIHPQGLNNKNEIVGVGETVDGTTHAVVLRPRK